MCYSPNIGWTRNIPSLSTWYLWGGANTIKNKDKELYIFFSRNKLLLKTFLPYHARLNFNVCPASPFWIGDLAIKLQLSGEQMGSLINKSFLYTCAVCASSSVLINDFRIERLFSASLSHRKKSFSGKSLSRWTVNCSNAQKLLIFQKRALE
jgi:hypothetical protein